MEFKDRSDFEKWVNLFRKLGVNSLKQGNGVFEITLSPDALFPESDYLKKKKDAALKDENVNALAEAEKLAFWSSDPIDLSGVQ